MGFNKTSDSQKMKAQAPSLNLNSAPQVPLTSDQIQKCLDDNKNLILAILECMSLGKFNESAKYQEILQQNLTYLASMADGQSSMQGSSAASQVLMNFVQQENQMQQTQAPTLRLQQESDHVPRLPPFLLNTPRSHQDQPLQPQQFQPLSGFRSATNRGMMLHQFMGPPPGLSSAGGGMDIQGSIQGGSSDGSWKPGYGGLDIHGNKKAGGSGDGSWKPGYGGARK